jgi:hypothetical protein
MSPEDELDRCLSRLANLKEFQDTGRDPMLLAKAWEVAWLDMVKAVGAWLAERGAM